MGLRIIQRINEIKSCFFERVKVINRLLATLTKKEREREKIEISTTRNNKADIAINTTEIQKILRDCYEHLYAHNLYNLEEMHQLLETYNLPKLNQEETEILNRPTMSNKI